MTRMRRETITEMRPAGSYVDLLRKYVGPQWPSAALLAALLLGSIGLLLLIGILVVVARESTIAGAVLTAFALSALLLLGRLRTIAVRSWQQVREVQAQLYGFLGEYLAGTEDIRSSGAEGHVMNGLAL